MGCKSFGRRTGRIVGKKKMIRGITSENIYVKLLSSYNWYTVLKIAGKEKLREILTDDIIRSLNQKPFSKNIFMQDPYYFNRVYPLQDKALN